MSTSINGKYTFNEACWWKPNNLIFSVLSTKQNGTLTNPEVLLEISGELLCYSMGRINELEAFHSCVGWLKWATPFSSEHFCPCTCAPSFLALTWLPEALTDIKISLFSILSTWNLSLTGIAMWIGKATKRGEEGGVLWWRFNSNSKAADSFSEYFFSWLLWVWFLNLSSLPGKSSKAFTGKIQ